MFELQTERLRLIPLDQDSLELLKEDRQQMEQQLGLTPSGMHFRDHQKKNEVTEVLDFWLSNVGAHPESYLWYTNWEIVLKKENTSIGGISFLGPPEKNGEVVLAFLLDPRRGGYGYMAEAMKAMISWAEEDEKLKRIVSYSPEGTEQVNKLLESNGFTSSGKVDGNTVYVRARSEAVPR